MPCYTVRLVSVEFKVQNEKILQDAARLLGLNYERRTNVVRIGPVTVDLDSQTAKASNQTDINALKQAYSLAAVKAAARAKGWTLGQWTAKAGTKTTVASKY